MKTKMAIPIPSEQLSILLKAQITVYDDFVQVFIFNEPVLKKVPGYENKAKQGAIPQFNENGELVKKDTYIDYETNMERSIRRTKKKIKDYALCNDFDLFVTFTFDKLKVDRYSVEACKAFMAGWLKNQRKRLGQFRYLIVMEYHKDGAIHFHALVGGYKGKVLPKIDLDTGKQIIDKHGRLVFRLPSYRGGWSDALKIDKDNSGSQRVGTYIQKYITKDMRPIFNKNRYWASKRLKLPRVIDNPEGWFLHVIPDWQRKLHYGTVMRFNAHDHPLVEMYWKSYRT